MPWKKVRLGMPVAFWGEIYPRNLQVSGPKSAFKQIKQSMADVQETYRK